MGGAKFPAAQHSVVLAIKYKRLVDGLTTIPHRPDGSFQQDDDGLDITPSSAAKRVWMGEEGGETNDENRSSNLSAPRRVVVTRTQSRAGLTLPQHSTRLAIALPTLRPNNDNNEVFTDIDPTMFDIHRRNYVRSGSVMVCVSVCVCVVGCARGGRPTNRGHIFIPSSCSCGPAAEAGGEIRRSARACCARASTTRCLHDFQRCNARDHERETFRALINEWCVVYVVSVCRSQVLDAARYHFQPKA
jgi:hypothetical protein